MSEVTDVTEPIGPVEPSPARKFRLWPTVGGIGIVAVALAGALLVRNSIDMTAPSNESTTSAIAAAPPKAPAPEPAPAPPSPTPLGASPMEAYNSNAASARTTHSSGAGMPDFSLPAFDWNPPPPPDLPPVDWSTLAGQVAAANSVGQAGAIVGPIAGTAGTVFAGTTSLLGDLILASAYNGNGGAVADPITALLSVIGAPVANTAAPNAVAALQSVPPLALPPPPNLLNPLGLPPPPSIGLLPPPAIGLPPPPDLRNPLGLPPPPPPIGLPPPPNLLNPLGLHLWPFF